MPADPILLVEDSADDRFFLERAYQKSGFGRPLVVALDGAEALEHFAKEGADTPAIVLLDLKLPKVGGLDVLAAIRKSDPSRKTIVICLTGSQEPSDRRRAYEEGANGYLLKPASMEDIERMLKGIKAFWLDHNVSPRSPLIPRSEHRASS